MSPHAARKTSKKRKLRVTSKSRKRASKVNPPGFSPEYKSIFNSIGDAMHVVNRKMQIVLINEAFVRWNRELGYRTSVIGKTPFEVFPFLPKRIRQEYQQVFQTGEVMVTEDQVETKKGEIFTETRKIPIKENGKVIQVVTAVRNITDRKIIENRLKKAQEFSDSIINSLPGSFYVVSAKGEFVQWNRNLEKVSGYNTREIAKMNPLDFFPLRDKEFVAKSIREVFEEGEKSIEVNILTKDGREVPFFFHGIRIIQEGAPFLIGTGFDISERKRIEEMIRFTVQGTSSATGGDFFLSIVKCLATALGVRYAFVGKLVGPDNKRIQTLAVWTGNDFAENFEYDLGGSPCEQVVGKKLCVFPKDVQKLFPEDPLLGDLKVESYVGNPLFDSNGKPLGLLSIMDDKPLMDDPAARACSMLTIFGARTMAELERMNAETALRESELKYRTLIDAANDAIFIADATSGYILDANKKAQQLIGLPIERIVGLHQSDLHPKSESQFSREVFKVHTTEDAQYQATAFVQHVGGKKIPVQISGSIANLQDKKIMIGIFRDITDLKRIEEGLRQDRDGLKKQVGETVGELDRAQKKLEDARRLAEVGALAATIAHELRNPLGVIKTATYNIRHKMSNPDLEQHVANIEKKIAESEQIIRNLLGYSKIKVPHFEDVNACKIMDDCIAHSKERFSRHKIKVECRYDGQRTKTIKADPIYLVELFTNILDNAFQSFNSERGSIVVSINCDSAGQKGECRISVTDNGAGIDPEILHKIYDPFFTTRSKGTGLGLSICNQIVNLHEGRIDVRSVKGEGTSVFVNLPMTRE